jgi:flotillin
MSVEKLEFLLPAVMTIGPRIEQPALEKYARLMTGRAKSNVPELVKGIIEGETRVIAAGMSMEEIFKVSMHEYVQVFQCTTTGK